MKIFAISDLHLSGNADKPMHIFGAAWDNYTERIAADWQARVGADDVVLLSGDLSWAMNLEDAVRDMEMFLSPLPGKKVLIRGNHEYWWHSISKVRAALPPNIFAVQNDCLRFEDVLVCGTRGWTLPEGADNTPENKKIFDREVLRLKLTLADMQKQRAPEDFTVCMLHYPPFNSRRGPSEMTALLTDAAVSAVVYGHLHGKECRADASVRLSGIPYYLTSCDLTGHRLIEVR